MTARAFVAAKLPTEPICVTSFATKELLLAPFTDSEAEASAALESIKVDPVKGTALYDDVQLASQTLAEEEGRARIIILVTDGNETLSSATLADAIKGAQEAETTVYVVAIESKAFTPGPLKYLAKRTGSRYYGAPSPGAAGDLRRARRRAEAHLAARLRHVRQAGGVPQARRVRAGARPRLRALADRGHGRVAKPGGLLPTAAYGEGGPPGSACSWGCSSCSPWYSCLRPPTPIVSKAQVQKHIAPKPKRSKSKQKKSASRHSPGSSAHRAGPRRDACGSSSAG